MAYEDPGETVSQRLSQGLATRDALISIEGGRVVTPSGTIEGGTVVISGDRIERVRSDPAPFADRVVDATDRIVMPGLIDVHGDDFEQQLSPRSEASVDPRTAFMASDRLNVSHGVTTKAHAIAFEHEEAEHRSPRFARELIAELARVDGLLGTNLVHARFEVSEVDADLARDVLANDDVALVSLMHHTPDQGEYARPGSFEDRYVEDAGLAPSTVERLAQERSGTEGSWDDEVSELIDVADRYGLQVASHDDGTVADVNRAAEAGVDICEFPLTREAAARATDLGMTTVMGAPNHVRGHSMFDNLSARAAADDGHLDGLCSDYHPPSLLQAALIDTGEPLHRRVARVTERPADMLGLSDRGRLATGARADILVVSDESTPRATDVIVGGQPVLASSSEPFG